MSSSATMRATRLCCRGGQPFCRQPTVCAWRQYDFDRLDDAALGGLAGFGALDFFVVLHLDVIELLFEGADDFVDLVADGRGINLDAVINAGQLAQQGLGDFAMAGIMISPSRC